MQYDIGPLSNIAALEPFDAIAANGTTFGPIVDTLGYEAVLFGCAIGTVTDGTYTVTVQQADDVGFTANVNDVPAAETHGAPVLTTSDEIGRISSVGKQRFQRMKYVAAAVTTGVAAGHVFAVLMRPFSMPVAAQE